MNLDGRPQRYTWRPPSVRVLKSSERKRLRYSDMPHYSSSVLVLREPALAALADLLSADGELLPLDCPDAPMWLFNCCRVIDALDEGHSRVVRFPSSGRIMRVESYDFQVGRLIGVIFALPFLWFWARVRRRTAPSAVGLEEQLNSMNPAAATLRNGSRPSRTRTTATTTQPARSKATLSPTAPSCWQRWVPAMRSGLCSGTRTQPRPRRMPVPGLRRLPIR